MRALASLVLGLLCGTAQAHPHGRMDCAATLGAQGGRLAWVELRLTLDGGASQALRPRVALQGDEAAPPQAANFNRVLWGLLRQSDWMLAARPGPDHTPAGGPATAWDDGDSARLRLDPQGRLQVVVRLTPSGAAPPLQGLALECRDPTWYWLAGFAQPEQLQTDGLPCRAELGERQATSTHALTLQAAARAAGLPGADGMDDALARDDAPLAARAQLRCTASTP